MVQHTLFALQARHIDVEVHPIDPLDRQPHMMLDDLRYTLCCHPPGSDRAGFASLRRLDRLSVPTELGSIKARHQPAIGATNSLTRLRLRPTRHNPSTREHASS